MRNIVLNECDISYELERKQVKNINLRIRADGSVYVSANNTISVEVIEKFLTRKSSFILDALNKYEELSKYVNNERKFVTGESYRYLGKDLRLRVSHGESAVHSDGVYLELSVENINDIISKEKLITKWYDEQCCEIFPDILMQTYPIFSKYGVVLPKIIYREMISRWGSCRPKRECITLNKRLIETPRICIEYVVMHEFIHFLQPNHSKKFYELLSTLMPDWRERKRILENGEYYQIIIKNDGK
ncbi:MAG: M48 family metallopeptidase [Clostridiales bacterium]|jgi:predicted metal-dependent hydrolase|nr:M48 family metallopeptidase [Clostridiales bacterium]